MNSPRFRHRLMVGIVGTALLSSAAAYVGARYLPEIRPNPDAPAARSPAITAAKQSAAQSSGVACDSPSGPARFTCPMHPYIVQDHAGTCPVCGMTLVKLDQGGGAAACHSIQVDLDTQHRMGVKFERAENREMHKVIRAFATISQDESRQFSINPKVEGWIRKIHIQGPGQVIHKGDILYDVYSPEHQQRQRDYIDLLTRREALLGSSMELVGPNSAMLGSLAKERFLARQRLLAADIPLDVVVNLEKDRRVVDVIPVRASEDGVVSSIGMHEGSYVNPMQTVLTYADNRQVWAEVTLYPDQIEWIKNGDTIVVSSELSKNSQVRNRLDLSGIQIDSGSKTAKLRFPLENSKHAFIPGTFANAEILSSARKALSVPRDALIQTGHGNFVVTGKEGTSFRSVPVTTGLVDDDYVEIMSGLTAGDDVVVNAQFLMDSAGTLQAMQHREASGTKDDKATAAMPDMGMAR